MDDWIDILLAEDFEFALANLVLTTGDGLRFQGSGRLHWHGKSGVRVLAETDGANQLLEKLDALTMEPGKLIPRERFFSVTGQTQEGWNVSTDAVPLPQYQFHFGSPNVAWDFTTPGLLLKKSMSRGTDSRLIRTIMSPAPETWIRFTETEVRNEQFGGKTWIRDWMLSKSRFAEIAARKRADSWFEIRVTVQESPQTLATPDIIFAVRDAFSFLLGRRLVFRGYEHIHLNEEERYLSAVREDATRNTVPSPIGSSSSYLDHSEALIGQAVDFFLTETGESVARHLALCWDAADNQLATRLAVSSICLESLLRLASVDRTDSDPGYTDLDRISLTDWITSQEGLLSARFVKRIRGFLAALDHRRPVDILWDWQRKGFLGVEKEDIRAWESVRHPSTHGAIGGRRLEHADLQPLLNGFHRISNLINRIVLKMMNYEGKYIDYAKSNWPETKFPGQKEEGGWLG